MADISKIEGYDLKDATARASISSLETEVATKQNTLVSGTNIKTINSNTLLGSGNITISSIPSGGLTGQYLVKASNTDYDTKWATLDTSNLLTKTNIIDNLNSSSSADVLSAKQGKVLNDSKQPKAVIKSNISVSVTPTQMSSYCDWDTEQKYGYSATITVSGLTTNSLIQNLVMTDTILNSVAPIVTTKANGLVFYTEDNTALSGTIYTLVTSEVE